jgi:PAS domain S-box-containing protein
MARPTPTDQRVFLTDDDLIVSKTDTKGLLRYVNSTFIKVSGYDYDELMGKPHSMIRHPDMPRTIFRLLWEAIASGNEIFSYVKNMTKSGGYYWVLAHATPTFDLDNNIIGYHSNRRNVTEEGVKMITEIYKKLLIIENQAAQKELGIQESLEYLTKILEGRSVNEFFLYL